MLYDNPLSGSLNGIFDCGLLPHWVIQDNDQAALRLFLLAVILMYIVTRVAKKALEKALAENEDIDGILASPELPVVAESTTDLSQPLIIKIDTSEPSHEQ